MTFDPAQVGRGLGLRLRDLAAALERYDGFAFRPATEEPAGGAGDADVDRAATALVLRALRVTSDPDGWRILSRLAGGDATTAEVAAMLSCPRMVAWEQVNDLLQAGLVARDLDGDRLGLTEAGRGVVDLVRGLAEAAAEVVTR